MRHRRKTCPEDRCDAVAGPGGRCDKHQQVHEAQTAFTEAAVKALHYSQVDGTHVTCEPAQTELARIQVWWRRVCDSLNYRVPDSILRDEAEYAKFWCIRVAEQVVQGA